VKTLKMNKGCEGGIVLEASLTLPFYALLLLGAISLIQTAAADLALRSAVSETAKTIAAYMYPVGLLYAEGKAQAESSRPAQAWGRIKARAEAAQNQVERTEQFVDDYAAYLPEPLVHFAEGEQEWRESLEAAAGERVDEAKQQAAEAVARTVFTPIVKRFADLKLLDEKRLHVIHVDWPVPDDPDRAWIGIEATYEMKLALPIFGKTVVLKKKALERCWIGG
jgi:hypothetical protein